MYNQDIYDHYKPLRNHLRQLYLSETLYVLWAYNQLLQFNTPPPSNIEVLPEILKKENFIYRFISPWELEVLIKEALLNCDENSGVKTVRKWDYFAGAINKLKALEEYINHIYVNTKNVLLELTRIAHRQFPWQSMYPQSKVLTRYYMLFSQPELDKIIQKKTKLTAEKIFLIGTTFLGSFIKNPAHLYPISVNLKGLTAQDFEIFLRYFSAELKTLKEKLSAEQEFNEKYEYSFYSVRAFPLIKMDYHGQLSIVCPSPTLFFWRFTSGIYYEICGEKGFENAFGKVFQEYVGKTLTRALNIFPFYSEAEYHVGNRRKDSIDWIIEGDALLFIECKTRRMAYAGKSEITSDNAIINELDKIAEIIIQVYKTIEDFRNGYYTHFRITNPKQIFPLIVTLEDWYLFGDKLVNKLRELVEERFKNNNLPLEWLTEMPYSICSIDELEDIVQIIEKVGVKKFIENKVNDRDKKMYAYHSYTFNDYPEEKKSIKNLFDKEWKEMFAEFD